MDGCADLALSGIGAVEIHHAAGHGGVVANREKREREDEPRTREQAMPQGVPHTGEKVRSQSQEG